MANMWRMNMKRCEMNDLPGLLDFYRLVIRDTAEIAVHARQVQAFGVWSFS